MTSCLWSIVCARFFRWFSQGEGELLKESRVVGPSVQTWEALMRAMAIAMVGWLLFGGISGCSGDDGVTGATGPAGPAGTTGAAGEPGPAGIAGQDFDAGPRLYGRGSDGDLMVTENDVFETGREYANISIATGVVLTVPSGTVIRCTGEFDNDGTIRVSPVARSGVRTFGTPSAEFPAITPPGLGVSAGAAGFGSRDDTSPFFAYGGRGGDGIGSAARESLEPRAAIGGAGSVTWPFTASGYNSGGGSLQIRCGGEIRNPGRIEVNGSTGTILIGSSGGGGGGGAVLLASGIAVDGGGGEIEAVGANGQDGSDQYGAAGGGGGGFVHLIAPSVVEGSVNVSGGDPGAAASWTSTVRWTGGSGGGGSAGNGGRGGGNEDGTVLAATPGSDGEVFVIEKDPAEVL
ncbi:MAG: hypothetical protein AAF219_03995 [Myxococcota bacterium]